jgi:putative transposase
VRQDFIGGKGYLNYNAVDKGFKAVVDGLNNSDYTAMPTAASAQQTLKLLHNNWCAFFEANKAYKANPGVFTGKPRLPKYLDKQGRQVLSLPGQTVKADDGNICFPKAFNGFTLPWPIKNEVRQIRFVPHKGFIIAEVVYQTEETEPLPDNGNYFGIDLGVDNFATVVSNIQGVNPVIINGKGLKAINQFWNKNKAYYTELETRLNPVTDRKGNKHCRQTNRLRGLAYKRNNRVKDFMHKASAYITGLAVQNRVAIIIVGKNVGWKQGVNLGSSTNQKFTGIPHARFISMLTYKCALRGITVVSQEESYTSKTSHVDFESPCKYEVYAGKRVHRGLFKSASGALINADVNGAAQILRKVFPKVCAYGIVGCVNPVRVNVA